ncbi:hypothetical protein Patl1_03707 [Pistacia atlantica]|uniref:Uncharacterized protein n=1 Tax=Pistacia atlantica TaxID=434234 RepID=A0ACC1BQU8_9ROSI|nr:hypothetical protein Patl1_03707 [Pistacia atlantica]
MEGNLGAVLYDSNNVTEQVRFNLLVGTIMKEAANEDVGARVLLPSCNNRFELYPFYNENVTVAPPLHLLKAWKHWRDGMPLQLLDSTLTDSYSRNEVIRCIHMGLLCLQEDPADRPSMATIVLMLNSYSVTLPAPRRLAFFLGKRREASMATKKFDFDQSKSKSIPWSVDDALLKYILDNRVF